MWLQAVFSMWIGSSPEIAMAIVMHTHQPFSPLPIKPWIGGKWEKNGPSIQGGEQDTHLQIHTETLNWKRLTTVYVYATWWE